MDIEVLGGLRALENGVPVVPVAQPARQVFAVLAAYADQMVPTSVLTAELSELSEHGSAGGPAGGPVGDPAGELARSVLLTSVRQIRELLAGAADSAGRRTPETVLVSLPGGFLLDTGGGRSDQHEFARETGAGYRAMARGEFAVAARRLRGALRLWRGPAFEGIHAGPRLAARIADLESTRISALRQWVEAELTLGRHQEFRAELRAVVAGKSPETYRMLAESLGSDLGSGPGDIGRALRRVLLGGPGPLVRVAA
ncbi:BTAD domain-containing putative transcriptional regulator [Streptomyces sp. G-G2]|uniref:AfsR/SARP family transcriptional regulator n=1 Tax=Streptomyces sp. G-G2 TaxID=3046201 RepID=UPI0024B98E09|nr:BTAD domain-containing putative transcriptional regulator [Streptomyces sp. G-G2]MDJ0382544.1 BTAD domain-containing putative transcriptional regulator [Streptomyces sp. G-G2]